MKEFQHKINIHPVVNGFQVQIGCQQFVFNDPVEMGKELLKYFTNPEKTIKEYEKKYGFVNGTIIAVSGWGSAGPTIGSASDGGR
jgi:uncharacterized radical SAM superfamily protein